MRYTISEKKALKKLGIPDFRHITKDKVVKFASMLPYMDPEVAKKALEQFPTYKELAGELVNTYKEITNKVFESNDISQKAYYDACNTILDTLKKELESDTLSSEDRHITEDKMIEVAKMIGEMDAKNKKFLLKIAGIVGLVFASVAAAAAAILGSNSQISQNDLDNDDYDDDDDNIINVENYDE